MLRFPFRCTCAVALLLGAAALGAAASGADPEADPEADIKALRPAFARPAAAPEPAGNRSTPAKVALGESLFRDARLSGDGATSCATCHQPELSFSDGVARRPGHDGEPLPRRTPSLWNLAWGLSFFWDGRAPTLEAQASGPIENPREMGGDLAKAVAALAIDRSARAAFARAFPDAPDVSETRIRDALAAYQRTLVSPRTRFDAWVDGEDGALTADEKAGLRLFAGRAGCMACHRGWRFTDEAFHDIGLPQAVPDRGRGEVIGLHALDHAFKTPSLRERAWTAPYMHDGSLDSLEAVVDHYADGVVRRPTLSADLTRPKLTAAERARLVAFLATLSSDNPPRPEPMAGEPTIRQPRQPVAASRIGQRGRRFEPGAVRVRTGESLTFFNDDTRTHQVRVDDPRFRFASPAQEPGESLDLLFPVPGRFEVICGVHPEMRLEVTVGDGDPVSKR